MNESSDDGPGRDAPCALFDEVAHLGSEVAAALAVLHEAGHAYGKLTPENVVLDADGGVHLAAGAVSPPAGGSAAYRGPELAIGDEPTAAGDLYALGVVLYELIAGTLPPRREPPLRPSGVTGESWAVIRALLATDPAGRPSSARAVADALAGRVPRPSMALAAHGPAPDAENARSADPQADYSGGGSADSVASPAEHRPAVRPTNSAPFAEESAETEAGGGRPPLATSTLHDEALPPARSTTTTRVTGRAALTTEAAPLTDRTPTTEVEVAPETAAPATGEPVCPPAAGRPVVPAARTARRRRVRSRAFAGATLLGLAAGAWVLADGDQPAAEQVAARAEAPSVSLGAAVRAAPANGPIAYVRKQDGVWRLFRMNADGSGQAPLTDLGADTSPPVFSPDGTRIAFVGYRPGEEGLHVMNVDGTARVRLHESGRWPAFSPDGRTIAFDGMWHRNDELHTINVDGSGLARLTEDGRADAPRTPVFSPDGTKILCTGYVGDDQAVLLMNADGTKRRVLAPAGALPSFAPDGSKVAFTGTKDNEVYVIDADGTDATRLTHNRARDWFPRFSPDGSRIVFTSNRAGNDPNSEYFGAYVMNADGSGQTRLLESDLGRSVPAFSPDGTKIAVSALRGDPAEGEFDVYVLNADGTDRTALRAEGANPVWGPRPPD